MYISVVKNVQTSDSFTLIGIHLRYNNNRNKDEKHDRYSARWMQSQIIHLI